MKRTSLFSILMFVVAGCSDSKSSKQAPAEQPKVVKLDEGNPAPVVTSTPTPMPTAAATPATPIPAVKIKSTFSLFKLSAQESNLVRKAAKIVSVSIDALKVTSSAGINGSLLSAKCGAEVVAQSKVILMTKDVENEPKYVPSVVIPADFICASEIVVTLDVYGLEVELGDVNVADVVSVGKATLLPEG